MQPVHLVLIVAGLISCFYGRRFFVVAVCLLGFAFGLGVAKAWSITGLGLLASGLLGALVGLLLALFLYFLAVLAVGALGGLLLGVIAQHAAHVALDPLVAFVALPILGGLAAIVLHRHAIIVATAFSGAWMTLAGATSAVLHVDLTRLKAPLTASRQLGGRYWVVLLLWVLVGAVGAWVQYGTQRRHSGSLSAEASHQRWAKTLGHAA